MNMQLVRVEEGKQKEKGECKEMLGGHEKWGEEDVFYLIITFSK